MMGFQARPTEHESAEVVEQAITLFLSLYGKNAS